jgi:hypothetical protein
MWVVAMNDPELLNKVYMFLIQNFRDKFLNANAHEIRSLIKDNIDKVK